LPNSTAFFTPLFKAKTMEFGGAPAKMAVKAGKNGRK
jgi:hypothetical protein